MKSYYSFLNEMQYSTIRENKDRILFEDKSMGASAEISVFRLGFALLLPLSVAVFAYYMKLNIVDKILVSLCRTIVQLLLAGYVLLSFIFSMKSALLVIAYLFLMTVIAAVEATYRQVRTYPGHFYDLLLCIILLLGGNHTLWYQPVV